MSEIGTVGDLVRVPLDQIQESPWQVRKTCGTPELDAEIAGLAESIVAAGLANPPTLRPLGGGIFEIVAGHRRVAAMRHLGWTHAPALLQDLSDEQAQKILLTENIQRRDLRPIEEGRSVAGMLARGFAIDEIARISGRSGRWVYRRASLAKLVPEWERAGEVLGLSAAYLERVSRLPAGTQVAVYERIAKGVVEDPENTPDWRHNRLAGGGDMDCLEHDINMETREIGEAPWLAHEKDCADLCAACAGCLDRSDKAPELWDDGEEARCLNSACWEEQKDQMVALLEKALDKKSKGALIRVPAEGIYSFMPQKSKEYSIPVLATTGENRGMVRWAKPPSAEDAPEKPKGPTPAQKDQAKFCKAVEGIIRAADSDWPALGNWAAPGRPDAMVGGDCVVMLFLAFGSGCSWEPQQVVSGLDPWDPIARLRLISSGADAAGKPLWEGTVKQEAFAAMWQGVRVNLLKRLRFDKVSECDDQYALAEMLVEMLDIPHELISQAKKGQVGE